MCINVITIHNKSKWSLYFLLHFEVKWPCFHSIHSQNAAVIMFERNQAVESVFSLDVLLSEGQRSNTDSKFTPRIPDCFSSRAAERAGGVDEFLML